MLKRKKKKKKKKKMGIWYIQKGYMPWESRSKKV